MAANNLSRIAMRRLNFPKASRRFASSRLTERTPASSTIVPMTSRSFSTSFLSDHVEPEGMDHRMPVTKFTEDEEMVRDTARIWANQELKPLVRDMDNECKTRPEVIQGLFDHGFMGMVCFTTCKH